MPAMREAQRQAFEPEPALALGHARDVLHRAALESRAKCLAAPDGCGPGLRPE